MLPFDCCRSFLEGHRGKMLAMCFPEVWAPDRAFCIALSVSCHQLNFFAFGMSSCSSGDRFALAPTSGPVN